MKKQAAPIIAALLLLLPLLYVGSYLLLVWPDGERFDMADSRSDFATYRHGAEAWAGRLYWPLEQMDRRVRPKKWAPQIAD
jgi:hypothetical protein